MRTVKKKLTINELVPKDIYLIDIICSHHMHEAIVILQQSALDV